MGIPSHQNWYECNGVCSDPPRNKEFPISGFGSRYEFPLPVVKNAPVPSNANYNPTNVAWMIEFFADILGTTKDQIAFRYENNTPLDPDDDIFVSHPGGTYLPNAQACKAKSKEQKIYEAAAKKSVLLKLYQDNSPANITYFDDPCPDELYNNIDLSSPFSMAAGVRRSSDSVVSFYASEAIDDTTNQAGFEIAGSNFNGPVYDDALTIYEAELSFLLPNRESKVTSTSYLYFMPVDAPLDQIIDPIGASVDDTITGDILTRVHIEPNTAVENLDDWNLWDSFSIDHSLYGNVDSYDIMSNNGSAFCRINVTDLVKRVAQSSDAIPGATITFRLTPQNESVRLRGLLYVNDGTISYPTHRIPALQIQVPVVNLVSVRPI